MSDLMIKMLADFSGMLLDFILYSAVFIFLRGAYKTASDMKRKNEMVDFPEGLRSEFEVVSHDGSSLKRTWILKDNNTGNLYTLSPETVKGWDKEKILNDSDSFRASIIVNSNVAMELRSGIFYFYNMPSSLDG